jgi:hypothetical protein
MAKVGVRVKGYGCKKYDCGPCQSVRRFDGYVQCGIIHGALCSLHPVNHAGAGRIRRPCAAHGYARVLDYLQQFIHLRIGAV